jgi:cytochrome P450
MGGPRKFYPAIKQLTLDLAADSFIGLPLGPEADKINKAFVDMVQASVAWCASRCPSPRWAGRRWPGASSWSTTSPAKPLRRREEGGGQDMFSQFATATHEDGSLLPVDEVVDHMIFLMMAAHDTITSPPPR